MHSLRISVKKGIEHEKKLAVAQKKTLRWRKN